MRDFLLVQIFKYFAFPTLSTLWCQKGALKQQFLVLGFHLCEFKHITSWRISTYIYVSGRLVQIKNNAKKYWIGKLC